MDLALMFDVKSGGESVPIKWGKENLKPDTSIIILDEGTMSLYLWHGVKQGLVARRTALRQAESLKGHGFTIGKSIIGRDIKTIKEIDARKVGRVPEETKLNEELEFLLNREYRVLDNLVITFSLEEVEYAKAKILPKKEPKPEPAAAAPPVPEPKPISKAAPAPTPQPAATATPIPSTTPSTVKFASEYDMEEPLPTSVATEVKPEPKPQPAAATVAAPKVEAPVADDPLADARVAFVLRSILDHFDDIWVSKKEGGSFAVEMMDGPVCQFSVIGGKLNFTSGSFTGIDPKIKSAIQQKYVKLSKLL